MSGEEAFHIHFFPYWDAGTKTLENSGFNTDLLLKMSCILVVTSPGNGGTLQYYLYIECGTLMIPIWILSRGREHWIHMMVP